MYKDFPIGTFFTCGLNNWRDYVVRVVDVDPKYKAAIKTIVVYPLDSRMIGAKVQFDAQGKCLSNQTLFSSIGLAKRVSHEDDSSLYEGCYYYTIRHKIKLFFLRIFRQWFT